MLLKWSRILLKNNKFNRGVRNECLSYYSVIPGTLTCHSQYIHLY